MRKLFAQLTLVLCIAASLGLLGNRLLWGYWLNRPSLMARSEIKSLAAISSLSFDATGAPVIKPNRQVELDQEKAACKETSASNECLDGRIVKSLEKEGLLRQLTPQVSSALLERVWVAVGNELWLPAVRAPRYRRSGVPVDGMAIHFKTEKGEFLLITRRTSEIANDRYAYSEALVDLKSSQPKLDRQVHFYYEIAGLEFVSWPLLSALSFAVLTACLLIAMGARWAWRIALRMARRENQ